MDKFPPRIDEVVLRPVALTAHPAKGSLTYTKTPARVDFERSPSGKGLMCWAKRNREVDNLWVISLEKKGMVCFIDGEIPTDYTHFKITGVGRYDKNVHATPAVWPEQDLLDLYTTPNEERATHDELAARVMDVLKRKPHLLPIRTLVKGMPDEKFVELCTHWFNYNRADSPTSDKEQIISHIVKCVEVLK